MTKVFALLLVAALLAGACSEADEGSPDDPDPAAGADETAPDGDDAGADEAAPDGDDAVAGDPDADTLVERRPGSEWTFGTLPDTPVAADPDAEPILVGMINQENTPLGSFPEIRGAVQAAVSFINAELGGVDGRPIELRTCITSFSAEESTSCAQEMISEGVVALVGGIDVTSNASFPLLEDNQLPQLGGIPTNTIEQSSSVGFYFSGGTTGGLAAFAAHAADNGAESIMIAHGEFDSFTVAARDYGAPVAESLGLEVDLVGFPVTQTDFLPILTRAQDTGADAVIVLTADSACLPVMELFAELGLTETSQLYLTGACAADEIIAAEGARTDGVIFNSESSVDDPYDEGPLFQDVTALYAEGPSQGAGTVGFRSMMNLWDVLVEVGADEVSAAAVIETVRAAVDRPSFWGHPYTCDGEQVPGLQALCAPQQTLMTVEDAAVAPFGDWIDTPALFSNALDG